VLDHDYVRLYVIGNHFKSGPDENVRLRTEQADYNGGLVAAVKAAGADRGNAYVAVAGDLNVYPDSPQLAGLRAQARNTYDSELYQPAGRYGYIYDGTSQTLDQIFASPTLYDRLAAVAAAHVNADYAYTYRRETQGLYGASDHDPIVVTFDFPPAPAAQIFLPLVGR
jgi:predicted extracellular nuclease